MTMIYQSFIPSKSRRSILQSTNTQDGLHIIIRLLRKRIYHGLAFVILGHYRRCFFDSCSSYWNRRFITIIFILYLSSSA